MLAVGGRVKVDAFPFDRAPAALAESVVDGVATAVTADATARLQQGLLEGRADTLAALVGVEEEGRRVLLEGGGRAVRQKPPSSVFDSSQLRT